jgi:hypothetical protein
VENHFMIGDKAVDLFTCRGAVMAVKGDSRMDYSERWSTLANANLLHSELNEQTNFFFKTAEGKEFSVTMPALVPIRESHQVTVVYGRCSDGESASAIGVYNETTDQLYSMPIHKALLRLEYKSPGQPMIALSGCLTAVFAIVIAILLSIFVPQRAADMTVGAKWFWFLLLGGTGIFVLGAYILDPMRLLRLQKAIEVAMHEAIEATVKSVLHQ